MLKYNVGGIGGGSGSSGESAESREIRQGLAAGLKAFSDGIKSSKGDKTNNDTPLPVGNQASNNQNSDPSQSVHRTRELVIELHR